MKYSSPRGTRDILPEEAKIWQITEEKFANICGLFNFQEIRTPVFESTDLFARSIGTSTDIVAKEMYTFLDKKGRSLTLRPEATASVVRAAIENNLLNKDKITKLYYIGPMFRYERPQAGRQRQFHQVGIEAFGSSDPMIDVEAISLADQFFKALGLKNLEINVNSVGCPECRPKYVEKLKQYFAENVKNMCEDCNKRFEFNPMRILDCKEPKCQSFIIKAPASIDSLCQECRLNFEQVELGLKAASIKYAINNRLVRGLDYYTRTTFEIVSKSLGAQNAVCGGGRYDKLVEELGGSPTPAVGFAIGLERLVEIMKAESGERKAESSLKLFIATLGEPARKLGFEILQKAREAGISADIDYLGKSLKSQMKEADKIGAQLVLILGEDEIKSGKAQLRNMKTTDQEEVTCDAQQIVAKLQQRI